MEDDDEPLTPKEVRVMLKMDDTRTFNDFRRSQPLFPRPYVIGKTKGKLPIVRWSKKEVRAFLTLMKALEREQNDAPEEEEN